MFPFRLGIWADVDLSSMRTTPVGAVEIQFAKQLSFRRANRSRSWSNSIRASGQAPSRRSRASPRAIPLIRVSTLLSAPGSIQTVPRISRRQSEASRFRFSSLSDSTTIAGAKSRQLSVETNHIPSFALTLKSPVHQPDCFSVFSFLPRSGTAQRDLLRRG